MLIFLWMAALVTYFLSSSLSVFFNELFGLARTQSRRLSSSWSPPNWVGEVEKKEGTTLIRSQIARSLIDFVHDSSVLYLYLGSGDLGHQRFVLVNSEENTWLNDLTFPTLAERIIIGFGCRKKKVSFIHFRDHILEEELNYVGLLGAFLRSFIILLFTL